MESLVRRAFAAVLVVFEHLRLPSPALTKMSYQSPTHRQSPSTREEEREEGDHKGGTAEEKGGGR